MSRKSYSLFVVVIVFALLVAFVQPAFASNGNSAGAGCDWRCQAARAKAWVARDTAVFRANLARGAQKVGAWACSASAQTSAYAQKQLLSSANNVAKYTRSVNAYNGSCLLSGNTSCYTKK